MRTGTAGRFGLENAATSSASGRPPSYRRAIWLPAGLSAALLFLVALASFWINQRDAQSLRLGTVLDSANRQLAQLQLSFLDEVAAWRAYLVQGEERNLAAFRMERERSQRIVTGLNATAARVGPEFHRELASLPALLTAWEAAPVAVMSSRLSRQAYEQQLPQQEALADRVTAELSRIDDAALLPRQRLVAELARLARRRLVMLAALLPIALAGTVLTARFAKRAMRNYQLAMRNAAYEALLRDSMAALTGAEVLPVALSRIATNAMRLCETDGAFIEHSNEARQEVEIAAAVGTGAPPGGTRVPFSGSMTDEIVRAGTPMLLGDLSVSASALGRPMGNQWQHSSALVVPLPHDGNVTGALVLVQRDQKLRVSEEMVARLQALGAWAALALHRQELASQLETERVRLEGVVMEMPVGVALTDASGRVVVFNRQAVETWGSPARPPQAIEEYAKWRLYRPDGQSYPVRERPLARSILTGEVVKGEEAEIERDDGTRRDVLISSAPIRDAGGVITAGVATISDISEEKKRERGVRLLDEISRQLASTLDYDATIQAILQLMVPRLGDYAAVYHRVGDSLVRKWGTGADPKVHQLFRDIDRELPLPLHSAHPVAVAVRTGTAQLREFVHDDLLTTISRNERELQWLRSLGMQSNMALPLTVRGTTIGALTIVSVKVARHFTYDDLAFAEEIARRAALAIDNAQLFRSVNETGRSTRFLSDAALDFSGTLEADEVLRRVTELAVPFLADFAMAYVNDEQGGVRHAASAHRDSSRQQVLAEVADLYRPNPTNRSGTVVKALTTGQPALVEDVTSDVLDSQGFDPRVRELFDQLAPVSWMAIPLVARDTTLGVILFASAETGRRYGDEDVSLGQRVASRAALALQNAQLYQGLQTALTTRDEVLAIVSHDLRNPLHTIGMGIQMLLDVPLDESERRRHLEVIGRAKTRMDRLIQDLLDVTRIEAGKTLAVETRRERPSALIREACESFVDLAQEKHVRFEWIVPDELPDVSADRGRILQVLSNLIGNALKFTPDGGRVEVRAVEDKGMVLVSVHDTGPGIADENLKRMFHSFWQAPRTARLGAGLGLTISRAIIEQHGGRIWAKSREGAGSTLCFTLPEAERQDGAQAAD